MMTTNKIILDLAITLDGYIEGPNGEVDWCIMDEEMNFNHFLEQIDTIIYGKKSYDLWGEFMPNLKDDQFGDKMMWDQIHSKQKFVFTSQNYSDKAHTKFINGDDISSKVLKIKKHSNKDIWLYGGSTIITTFINLNLIDEYRLSIHPVILGSGKPLFEHNQNRVNISLCNTHVYKSGVVQMIYQKID